MIKQLKPNILYRSGPTENNIGSRVITLVLHCALIALIEGNYMALEGWTVQSKCYRLICHWNDDRTKLTLKYKHALLFLLHLQNGADLLSHCDRHRIGVYGGVFAQQCRWCPAGILSPGWYRPHEWPAAHNTAPAKSQEEKKYITNQQNWIIIALFCK